MRNRTFYDVIVALPLLTTGFAYAPPALASQAGDRIPGRYICVFASGPSTGSFEAHSLVAKVGGRVTHVFTEVLQGFAATLPERAARELVNRNPRIQYCEEDRVVRVPSNETTEQAVEAAKPGTGGGPGGGGSGPCADTIPWGVKRVGGPAVYTGPNRAWVIDTGIGPHSELNIDTVRSKSFLTSTNFPGLDNPSSFNDYNGHGTHVAGTIAAKCNGTSLVGVAADALVVSLRVLDLGGSGADSDVLDALDDVYEYGAPGDVVNLSLEFDTPASSTDPSTGYQAVSTALSNVAQRGIFVVIAAGNNSGNADNYLPGALGGRIANVFTVSASDSRNRFASFSNFGANPPIQFAEPGVRIQSLDLNNGTSTKSGTSMAAPHLSGILLARGSAIAGAAVTGDPAAPSDPVGQLK